MCSYWKAVPQHNPASITIEQINRLFREKLNGGCPIVDNEGRIRLDDYEMKEDVQSQVMEYWDQVNSDNINKFADMTGYWDDFYHMFGFRFDEIDYTRDVIL